MPAPPRMLDVSAYYAPIPILHLDRRGCIADFNLALKLLLGRSLIGCRRQPAEVLAKRLAAAGLDQILPPDDTWIRGGAGSGGRGARLPDVEPIDPISESEYASESLGTLRLRGWAVCHNDPETGEQAGTTIYWDVAQAGEDRRFRAALGRLCRHQLTWEIYASSYDRILPVLPFYREVVERHVAAMSSPGIRDVADIGAGTGNVTLPLLRAGRQVTAIDHSRAMLDRLRWKTAREPVAGLVIMEEDAECLPLLADASFDGVATLLAFYDMRQPQLALREAIRILRPGGRFIATEPRLHFDLRPLLEFADAYLRDQGMYDELGDDWERVYQANEFLDPAPRSPLRAEVIRDVLAAEGFGEIGIRDSHLGQCATITARKP